MPFAQSSDFDLEKQRAAERLKEMANRSRLRRSTFAPEPAHPQNSADNKSRAAVLPGGDPDTALVMGLLLLLTAEGADKLLLLALIYILM